MKTSIYFDWHEISGEEKDVRAAESWLADEYDSLESACISGGPDFYSSDDLLSGQAELIRKAAEKFSVEIKAI